MHTKVEWDWNNLKIALVNLIRRHVRPNLAPPRNAFKSSPLHSTCACSYLLSFGSTYYQGQISVHFPEQRNTLSVMCALTSIDVNAILTPAAGMTTR